MIAALVPLALVVLAAAAAPPAAVAATTAAQHEADAFAAIDAKRWCDAVQEFLRADALAPSEDLVMNAAMAAQYGGDRAAARGLYERARVAKGARAAEAAKHVAQLDAAIDSEGAGAACPAPPQPTATASPPSAPPATAAPTVPSAPPASVVVEPPASSTPLWPLAVVGAGAALAVVGGVAAGVGTLPWYQHESAVEALAAAESKRGSDKAQLRALQQQQHDARAAWESYGQLAAIAGVVVVSVGVVVVGTGVALFVLEGE